ncbi:NAC domain-containing protein 40-like [Silene latifolia]|uniref:NAC domain-containing protein 40-like n=1 Tax=Silene latifolia TaxID=37657 RepID=UPI003D77DC2A
MKGVSKEAEISIAASSMFPGFRFSPTDEELILYYLKKKLDGFDKCVELIPVVDICKFEPWDLPAKSIIKSDQEWFFFSPRGKKYPNGSQSKRATEIGYWKATGKERNVKSGANVIGTKRTLVFHIGRAPKGERTEWIMHEYCMSGKGQDALVVCRLRRKCDYQATDDPNAQNNMGNNSLSMMGSSGTNSGCGLEPLCTTAGNKTAAESSMKKSSSSHDSHSVEQMDSASQTDWKFKDDILQPESSSHAKHQRVNDDDDLFAEILNDNIVQLDEPLPTSTGGGSSIVTTTTTTVSIVPRTHRQPGHPNMTRLDPTQGTTSRRIRLRKLRRISPRKGELEEQIGENVIASPKLGRFWRLCV